MIVCGYDGSPFALEALEVSAALARKQGARLAVIQVFDTLGVDETIARHQAELVSAIAPFTDTDDVQATTGSAVEDLLAAAARRAATLIVVGARGLGRVLLLGSVSGALVSRSPVPVLVVRRREPLLDAVADRAPLRVCVAHDGGGAPEVISWCETARRYLLLDVTTYLDPSGESPAAAVAEHATRERAGLVAVLRQGRALFGRGRARAIVAQCPTNALCVPRISDEAK